MSVSNLISSLCSVASKACQGRLGLWCWPHKSWSQFKSAKNLVEVDEPLDAVEGADADPFGIRKPRLQSIAGLATSMKAGATGGAGAEATGSMKGSRVISGFFFQFASGGLPLGSIRPSVGQKVISPGFLPCATRCSAWRTVWASVSPVGSAAAHLERSEPG